MKCHENCLLLDLCVLNVICILKQNNEEKWKKKEQSDDTASLMFPLFGVFVQSVEEQYFTMYIHEGSSKIDWVKTCKPVTRKI